VATDDLVIDGAGDAGYALTRAQETDLPGALKLSFVDAYQTYGTGSVTARRALGSSSNVASVQVGAVLEPALAQTLALGLLQQAWAARETGQIKLPPAKIAIDPGDVLSLSIGGFTRAMRVKTIDTGLYRSLDLFGFDPALARGQGIMGAAYDRRSAPAKQTFGGAIVEFLNIPLLNADDPKPWAPRIAAFASPWAGVSIYRASGAGFQLIGQVSKASVIGELTAPLFSGPRSVWDRSNAVDLVLYDKAAQLLSFDESQTLSGAGALAVKNPANGQWEILQYVTATLTGPGTYRLTKLLRAQQGTEAGMADPVPAGSRVAVLDPTALGVLDMTIDQRGVTQTLRWGPSRYPGTDASYAQADLVFKGAGLRPWSPSQLAGVRQANGDVIFSWERRTRFAGDSWDTPGVPLNEESESNDLEILNGASAVRTISGLASPSFLYTSAMQTADFGSQQGSYTIHVSQLSAAYGRGQAATKTIGL
jgi:hypothetical protein